MGSRERRVSAYTCVMARLLGDASKGLVCALTGCALSLGCSGSVPEDTAVRTQELPSVTSDLWGEAGELFVPTGRIMDWSYAGYQAGESPLPELTPDVSVTDFGAVADDAGDDTDAFNQAIQSLTNGGVVGVPAGRFVIRARVTLTDGVVLQGAGRGATELEIPVNLSDVYGAGDRKWSFSGAFIEAKGSDAGKLVGDVTAAAARGTRVLELSDTSGVSVGQWVRVIQTDGDGSLMNRLHADLMPAGDDNTGDKGMEFHSRVSAVDAGSITLERALPLDVETRWAPQVFGFEPRTTDVGLEHLSIRFPETTYPGHFLELGYNAVHFSGVAHSWVRDVAIYNADYGVNISSSFFVTVQDVLLDTTADRGSSVGHHGLNNGHGGDNLFIGFDVNKRFVHDLTNEWYGTGVVFTQGRGLDLAMDHHRAAPYTTLWTELDLGQGKRPFQSGGSSNRGPHTAAYDTLWNLSAQDDMDLPPDDYGPRINFVGFRTAATEVSSPYDWWFEGMAPEDLDPPNLWLAQREKRLGPTGSGGAAGSGGSAAGAGGSGAAASGGATSSGGSNTATGGSAGSSGAASAGASSGAAPASDDSGCGCRTGSRGSTPAWPLLALLGLVLCRRSRGAERDA